MSSQVVAWFDAARLDAERRGLPELGPLLTSLQGTIERLRAAAWNEDFGSTDPRPDSDRVVTGGDRLSR